MLGKNLYGVPNHVHLLAMIVLNLCHYVVLGIPVSPRWKAFTRQWTLEDGSEFEFMGSSSIVPMVVVLIGQLFSAWLLSIICIECGFRNGTFR